MGKPVKPAAKYKLTLTLDHELARRFAAYAGFLGEDQSAIVSRAIRRELKGFSIRRVIEVDDQADAQDGQPVRLARPSDHRESA